MWFIVLLETKQGDLLEHSAGSAESAGIAERDQCM
jgi:hypothetical protein